MNKKLLAIMAAVPIGAILATSNAHAACNANTSSWDCVEWDTGNANNTGGNYIGPGGTSTVGGTGTPSDSDVFTFTGRSNLGCSIASAECDLTLYGQVKVSDVADELGIKVTGYNLAGGGLCDSIELRGFPWYAADVSEHDSFVAGSAITNSGTLVPYSGTATGNMGNIGIYAFFGLINITDGHVHNVTFNNVSNGDSYFHFDSAVYVDGSSDNDSGCDVDGDLYTISGEGLNAW